MMIECDIVKNNKGQALVEFIIILPIFLLLIISMIDFGNIIYKKYLLENDIDIISSMYESNDLDNINKYINDKEIVLNYDIESDFTIIKISKNIKVISPALNLIFGKSYELSTKKYVYKNK